MESFLIARRRWKPCFIRAARTTFFPTSKFKAIELWLAIDYFFNLTKFFLSFFFLPSASCWKGSLLWGDDMHTYSIRASICAWVKTGGRLSFLVGVARKVHAHWTWCHETPVLSWICAYFQLINQGSWQSRRWSRVTSDFFKAGILSIRTWRRKSLQKIFYLACELPSRYPQYAPRYPPFTSPLLLVDHSLDSGIVTILSSGRYATGNDGCVLKWVVLFIIGLEGNTIFSESMELACLSWGIRRRILSRRIVG